MLLVYYKHWPSPQRIYQYAHMLENLTLCENKIIKSRNVVDLLTSVFDDYFE